MKNNVIGIIMALVLCVAVPVQAKNVEYKETLAAKIYQKFDRRIQALNKKTEELNEKVKDLCKNKNEEAAWQLSFLIGSLGDDVKSVRGIISPEGVNSKLEDVKFESAASGEANSKELLDSVTRKFIRSFITSGKNRRSEVINIILSVKETAVKDAAEKVRDLQNEYLECFQEITDEIEGSYKE